MMNNTDKQLTYCDFMFCGEHLAIMDITGKSDPYFVIKVPTSIVSKRNIFEYELSDVDSPRALGSSGGRVDILMRKNSQGSVYEAHTSPEERKNILSSLASSALSTSNGYYYHKKPYPHSEGYKVVYESEVIKSNLDPLWEPFRIGFHELCKGNSNVELQIECYDWDLFKFSDFIGLARITVQELVEAQGEIILQLLNKKGENSGTLKVKCAPAISDLVYCDFRAHAERIPKMNLRGSADPYIVIKTPKNINERRNMFIFSYDGQISPALPKMKIGGQNHPSTEGYREIYESPIIKSSLNPDWGIFRISFYDMCRGNPETKLLIECYDFNDLFPNKLIGTAMISVQYLLDTRGKISIPFLSKKSGKVKGMLHLHSKPSNSITRLRKVTF